MGKGRRRVREVEGGGRARREKLLAKDWKDR